MASSKSLVLALRPFKQTSPSVRPCHACLRLSRQFSSSQSHQAKSAADIAQTQLTRSIEKTANQPQRGSRSRMADGSIKELPTNDFGLAPDTFIRPTGVALPMWVTDVRRRARLEWYWVKTRLQGIVATWAYCRWNGSGAKQLLRFAERRKVAQALHKGMYTALAKGDKSTLREICCDNLFESLAAEIARRPPHLREQTWKLVRYSGWRVPNWLPFPLPALWPFAPVRVISDRGMMLPIGKDSGIRQIVVRINSAQYLDRTGTYPELSRAERAAIPVTTEYIVLQKIKFNGKEEKGWKVWGTSNETVWADVERKEAKKVKDKSGQPGIGERFRSMLPGNGML